MYLIKRLRRYWFLCEVNDIPIGIWSQKCQISTINYRLVACLFCWLKTRNPCLVKHWCTCNTGTWYADNFVSEMTYIWIKTYMIMLTKTPAPWGFVWEPQNGNAGNLLVSQYIFTSLCATSALSWTWYSLSVHFLFLGLFLSFLWSMTPCLR